MNAYAKANVYSQISEFIGDKMVSKVVESGGRETDADLLSNFISPLSLREMFEGNIQSFLSYANGASSEIRVFVPWSLEKTGDSSSMSLTEFLNEFNISGIEEKDLIIISKFGLYSWVLVFSSFALLILFLVMEYLLTSKGRRLTVLGTSLLLSGLFLFGLSLAGRKAADVLADGTLTSNIGNQIAITMSVPLIGEAVYVWLIAAAVFAVLGILLFLIKKSGNTKSV